MRPLVRLYPAPWRARYGDELEGLIADMSGGGRTPWRVRADVALGAARERLRAAGLGSTGTPEHRARGGLLLVLWAWALAVPAGAVIQKTSEHWRAALPAGGRGQAAAGFAVLLGAAVVAAALIVAGIALVLPATVRYLRRDRVVVRRRALVAAGSTALALGATAGVLAWAARGGAPARAGHDAAYAAAVVAWAAICTAALWAWTALAAAIARRIELRPATLRAEAGLAACVTVAMVAMSAGTAIWWAAVGARTPGFLGDSGLPPQLLLAVTAMAAATVLAGAGTRHALRALSSRPG